MADEVKLWRYVLGNVNGEGWAVAVLGSDGYFSAASDYGGYARLWDAHGCADFRTFIAKADRDPGYFIGKLSPGKEYDGDATYKAILAEISEREADGRISKDEADEERTLLEEHERVSARENFSVWHSETSLEDLDMEALYCEEHPSDVRAFCKKTLPRLAENVRAELAAEKGAASV